MEAIDSGVQSKVLVDMNLTFAEVNGRKLVLDLYRPRNCGAPLPIIVWIFGGAFFQDNRLVQAHRASWLAKYGYAVASIDYRLSSEALFPAQIHDCKAAVRWLRAYATLYNLDTENFGVWGASSGGYLSTMLGVTSGVEAFEGNLGSILESSSVQAVVDFYGPTDFLKMDETRLPDGQKHNVGNSPESRLLGAPIVEIPEKVKEANPLTYVNESAPPFLILHGVKDLLVPVNQSEILYEALNNAGGDVKLFKLEGVGHGGPQFYRESGCTPIVGAMVLAFLNQHLK